MSKKNVGFGIFLLVMGIIWLLARLGYVGWFTIHSAVVLSPLVLVVLGIGMIFNKSYVKTVSWILLLSVIVVHGYINYNNPGKGRGNEARSFREEIQENAVSGYLDVEIGGLSLNVASTDKYFADIALDIPGVTFDSEKNSGGKYSLYISKKNYPFLQLNNRYDGTILLSDRLIWDMNIKTGASKAQFDFSELKARDIELKAGAGDYRLILGDKYESMMLDIESGASSITIIVPENAGIKVSAKGALYNLNVSGENFEKINGVLYSKDYENADVKIEISIKTAASSIRIDRT